MGVKSPPSPIPFRDASGQYLPWVLAVMVFLATLALAGALQLNGAVALWQRGVADRLTVELPGDVTAARMAAVLESLRGRAGVAAVTVLSQAEVAELLEPWLGRVDLAALPVPRLVDVRIDLDSPPDLAALRRDVAAIEPGARVDDHKPWLDKLVTLGRSLQWLALVVVGLLALATVALVGFATRAGLAVHRDVVEVLHLIGAHDSYVARQFQRHTLILGVIGVIPGVLAAGLTLYGLELLAARIDAPMLPPLALDASAWLALAVLPVAAVLMAMLAARITVLRILRQMP